MNEIKHTNDDKEWWLNGKRHREDGAAIECIDGGKEWWLNGRHYSAPDDWARATLKHQGKCYNVDAVEVFLKQILKKYVDDAL